MHTCKYICIYVDWLVGCFPVWHINPFIDR